LKRLAKDADDKQAVVVWLKKQVEKAKDLAKLEMKHAESLNTKDESPNMQVKSAQMQPAAVATSSLQVGATTPLPSYILRNTLHNVSPLSHGTGTPLVPLTLLSNNAGTGTHGGSAGGGFDNNNGNATATLLDNKDDDDEKSVGA
jgi:hypothetical protein